jgi:uncharacterized protein involved in outer membrane biogenesis
MNWRRTALWSAGALVVTGIAGALGFHALVDPERLKRIAREKAAQAWSRELTVGEMSLRLFPVPSLHASDVALANAPWARSRTLATVDSVTARLELLPLLVGRARIKGLELEGVKVALEVSPQGEASWAMAPSGARDAKPAPEGDAQWLNLESLHIRDADIRYKPKTGLSIPWRIEEARLDADEGLRNVRIEANVSRLQRPLAITAELDALSRWGKPGATSEGRIDLDWGKTQLAATGRFPLSASLQGHMLRLDLKSAALNDMLSFFGIAQRPTAPVQARVESRDSRGAIEITRLDASLGKFRVTGDARLSLAGPKPSVNARLDANRLDWPRTLLDAGYPEVPGLEPDEMFRDVPLAWPLLVALQGSAGVVDVKLQSLVLRNGVELRNPRARMAFEGDRLDMSGFSAETLGGSASGSMTFEGRRKTVRVNLEGDNLLLERWFRERGSAVPFTGGPMKIKATFRAVGDSMKDLAGSMTGPVTIRMGRGVWANAKAGHAESVMASALSSRESTSIEFECIGAALPFSAGRASASSLIGARSTASNLLTAGFVDLRDETVELRGRVKPRKGSVGLATVAGDIKIAGKIRHPQPSLDPVGTPGAIARAGAAIVTAGLSLVGTALVDAANARKDDPCDAVFARN